MTRAAGVLVLLVLSPAYAQLPHIIGSWALNAEDSVFPGPLPRSQVRTYFPLDDGYLLGMVVTIDADGNPRFLQFAARPDGLDYPEYDPFSLALLQTTGKPTAITYSESVVDEYTVEWIDKADGETTATGTRRVSEDGQTLTIEFEMQDSEGGTQEFRLVYDKQ